MMKMTVVLSPSILAADFSCLADDVKRLEQSGIKDLHLDVMDGHFVSNITFGIDLIKHLRPITNLDTGHSSCLNCSAYSTSLPISSIAAWILMHI